MASNLYAALIGEGPSSAEKQAALADILRQRAGLAQVAQLSGDPTLAPMGQQQGQEVNQQAQALQHGQMQAQQQAQQAQQQARQAAFQQQQETRMAAGQQEGFDVQRRGQDLDYQTALASAAAAAQKAAAPKALTDTQATAQGMLGRMQAAEKMIGLKGTNTKDFAAAGAIYGGGGALASTMANKVMSKEGQAYYQAAADWVRAKLRKESGASIADTEMSSELRTYFPLPGDGPEQIAQKAAARKQAEAEMTMMGGGTNRNAAPRIVKRTGKLNGRKVVEYADGTVDYAD